MAGVELVRFDVLVAPEFLSGLSSMSFDDVRRRRSDANEVETGLSYLRRIVQGRLDIVLAERHRRDEGVEAGDIASLVDHLPEILSEHVHAPGFGRLTTLIAPGEIDQTFLDRMNDIIPPSRLGSLPALPDTELERVIDRLVLLEREISARRRSLHEVLDRLQEEIVRRYSSGEASVDNLLS